MIARQMPGTRRQWADGKWHVKQPDGSWPEEDSTENKMKETSEPDENGLLYKRPSSLKDCKQFKGKLDTAKTSVAQIKPQDAWRVSTDHKEEDYLNDKICSSPGGSVAAITEDGDIISVCKNADDKMLFAGTKILEAAIKAGGVKLDSYDGNFDFYVKNGFEPVSWCKFDMKYKPEDWDKSRDRKEPIVFFKYTGRKLNITRREFYDEVAPSHNYDEAMKKRDKEL